MLMSNCTIIIAQDEQKQDPKKMAEAFFTTYVKNPTEALNSIFATNKYFSKVETNVVSKKLNDFIKIIGKFEGYEFIQTEAVGTGLVLYNYIVKYERQPLKFTFIFYKANEIWMLYNFKFESELDAELEKAAQINFSLHEN